MENNAENVKTPVTEAELAEWQALCDAATPGPWYMSSTGEGRPSANYSESGAYHGHSVVIQGEWINIGNIPFAAASRTAVPRLIAEVRRLNDKLSLYVIENDELEGEKQEAEEWVQDIFTALKKDFPPCDDDPTEEGIYAKQVVDYIRGLVTENERLKGGTA